jgi:CRISPR-associated protein Cmr3
MSTLVTSQTHIFIEPLDVLFMRGNKLFGDPGSHGEALIPPWPSVAAGALRSGILAAEGVDLARFAKGEISHPRLGTPTKPGPFTLTQFTLGRKLATGGFETLHALPADLVVHELSETQYQIQKIQAQNLHTGMLSSGSLTYLPVMAEPDERRKAASGLWLTQHGWQRYLEGQLPNAKTDLVRVGDLWKTENRIGIGLNAQQRAVEDGKLFTTQAVSMLPGVGFVASVVGADVPAHSTLRLGGDGRAAAMQTMALKPAAIPFETLIAQRRCRLVLTTPGIFSQGWLPNGFTEQNGEYFLDLHGVKAKLVCASVPRSEVISGWDLAKWQPKPALRAAPAGSVYWLEDLQATPEQLGKLAECGLWSEPCEDNTRRAEGFNRFALAVFDWQ